MFCFLKFSNLNSIRKILKFNRLNTSTEPYTHTAPVVSKEERPVVYGGGLIEVTHTHC